MSEDCSACKHHGEICFGCMQRLVSPTNESSMDILKRKIKELNYEIGENLVKIQKVTEK